MANDKAPAAQPQPQMVAILQPQAPYKPGKETNKTYPQSEWVYVEVPEMDLLGGKHSGCVINGTPYKSGKHFVPPDIASEIQRIMRKKDEADIRINQPTKDIKALSELARRYPALQEA